MLVRQGEASRQMLSGAHERLRNTFDLPSRIKSSMTSAPAKWLAGSLIAGFAASLFFRPGKKKVSAQVATVKKERGFLLGLLALVLTLSKPAVKIYGTKLLKNYLSRRFLDSSHGRPGAMRTPPY